MLGETERVCPKESTEEGVRVSGVAFEAGGAMATQIESIERT
jgi:hypothetical protein